MKTIIKYIAIITALFCLNSCEQDLMDYEGEAGVYFAVQFPWPSGYGDTTLWELSPQSNVSFFLQKKADSTIKVRVQITGNTIDRDRQFKVVVVDTGSTAIVEHDYDPIPEIHTIRAHTLHGYPRESVQTGRPYRNQQESYAPLGRDTGFQSANRHLVSLARATQMESDSRWRKSRYICH